MSSVITLPDLKILFRRSMTAYSGTQENIYMNWQEAGRTEEETASVFTSDYLANAADNEEPLGVECMRLFAINNDLICEELEPMWDPLESTCRHASLSIL